MVILPYMNWGNLKLFLRQCKLVEANNPQVRKFPQCQWFLMSFEVDINNHTCVLKTCKEPQNESGIIYNLLI